jgi:hypothetical protein
MIYNSRDVFFDPFPALFQDNRLSSKSCENKMGVEIIEFYLHCEDFNKVIRLTQENRDVFLLCNYLFSRCPQKL